MMGRRRTSPEARAAQIQADADRPRSLRLTRVTRPEDEWQATGQVRVDGTVHVRWAEPWPTAREVYESMDYVDSSLLMAGYVLHWDTEGVR